MIGIVVVSHSRGLADQAVALASEMVPGESRPQIAVAAGLDEDNFGTDAAAIAEAIERVDSPDGVLVLMDLGSAILSAEMALEFVDPEIAGRVRLSPAPLVEGLVAAVVTAASGADLDAVDAEARDGLFAKNDHLGVQVELVDQGQGPGSGLDRPDRPDQFTFRWTVTNPHGLHARPAAALVAGLSGVDATVEISNASTGAGPASARSVNRIGALGLRQGDELLATASGPQAERAIETLQSLSQSQFGEAENSDPTSSTELEERTQDQTPTTTGLQIVLAPARRIEQSVDTSSYQPGDDEPSRLRAGLDDVATSLRTRATGPHGDIFSAQLALLTDPELDEQLTQAVSAGEPTPEAVRTTFEQVAQEYQRLDDAYLRERAQDLRSLMRQLLAALVGVESGTDSADQPHVLVVDELDAATAATLDAAWCRGVITITGGSTGHGVIVATGRGIPVLTGQSAARDLATGDLVGFDPSTRELWIRPDQTTTDQIRARAREREEQQRDIAAHAHEPAVTGSGITITVEANVSSLADARRGAEAGAHGSGLVRTELLWGQLTTAPSAQQQADDLVAIGRAMDGAMITVRTWDVGGDKPLPFLPQAPELNPFLGERGLRTMKRATDLFAEQLRGIVLASQQTPVRVMFPMVTVPDEVRWARTVLDEVLAELSAKPIEVGMMVEVPAAAVRAADFADLVDFVSIGTNDLTQYTCAVDRGNAVVADLGRADSPAVLDLIALTCAGLPDTTVAVCGDLASDPAAVAALVGFGVQELSVRPPLVGVVKDAVRKIV